MIKGQNTMVKVKRDLEVKKIAIMGRGNILGLEDIARMIPYSYSVKCESQNGLLLKIEVSKFQSMIKHFHRGYQRIS